MSRQIIIPVTFERGMDESIQSEETRPGSASVLVDWEPTDAGGLLNREQTLYYPEQSAGTTAFYSNSGRGMAAFAKVANYKQPRVLAVASSATATLAWAPATTAGSLLVAVWNFLGGSGVTITPPAGWSLAIRQDSSTDIGIAIYYSPNTASHTSEVFTITGASELRGVGREFPDVATTTPLDRTKGAASATANIGINDTVAQAQYGELAVIGFSRTPKVVSEILPDGGAEYVTTRGFNKNRQTFTGTNMSSVVSWRALLTKAVIVSVEYQPNDVPVSPKSVAALATFKMATGTGNTMKSIVGAYADADADPYFIAVAELDNPNGVQYLESISGLYPAGAQSYETEPIAMAAGAGYIVYSHRLMTTQRKWDGQADPTTTASSPPGVCLEYHQDRFWCGGTDANPTRLWYSDSGSAISWPTANFFEINQEDGDRIEDIRSILGGLLIAKRSGLWFLTGSGLSNWTVQRLDGGEGFPGRCIAPTPYGAVISGENSIYEWRGGSVESISDPVSLSWPGTLGRGTTDTTIRRWVASQHVDDKVYIHGFNSVSANGFNRDNFVFDLKARRWWNERSFYGGWSAMVEHRGTLYVIPANAAGAPAIGIRYPGTVRNPDVRSSGNYANMLNYMATQDFHPGNLANRATLRHTYIQSYNRYLLGGTYILKVYSPGQTTISRTVQLSASKTTEITQQSFSALQGVENVSFDIIPTSTTTAFDINRMELYFILEEER